MEYKIYYKSLYTDDINGSEVMKTINGIWSEEQIKNNPTAYLKYLAGIMRKQFHPQAIDKIVCEMERVREEYLSLIISKDRKK